MNERLDALIAPWDREDVPGGVIALAQGGQTILQRAFGSASLEQARPNTLQTRFPIGSVTKHMTAAAVVELSGRGVMDLDQPIRRWLPELEQDATLRQLADHTAGLRCYLDLAFSDGFAMQPCGAGLAAQVRQSQFNFASGTSQRYCNGGYLLLSLAIERATGHRFEDVLAELFFAPLDLQATESQRADAPIRPGLACGHVPLPGGGWARGLNVSEERLGDGSVVSTTGDMLRWARHLRTGGGLEALTAGPSAYGLGLMRESHRGLELIGHGGGVMGANCHLFWAPELDLEVIALCNGPVSARALALAALEDLAGDALAPALPSPASEPYWQWLGHYRVAETGMVFELADAGGVLAMGLFGSPTAPLLRSVSGQAGRLPFVLPGATGEFGFAVDGNRLLMIDAGVALPAERLVEAAPAADLEGRFHSGDAAADWHIDAGLAIEARGLYGFNRFNARPWPGGLLAVRHGWMPWFAIARPLGPDAFELSTGRTRRVRFERRAT